MKAIVLVFMVFGFTAISGSAQMMVVRCIKDCVAMKRTLANNRFAFIKPSGIKSLSHAI